MILAWILLPDTAMPTERIASLGRVRVDPTFNKGSVPVRCANQVAVQFPYVLLPVDWLLAKPSAIHG